MITENKILFAIGKYSIYPIGALLIAIEESAGEVKTWLMGALLSMVMALVGAFAYHLIARIGKSETRQDEADKASASVESRVSVVEAKVIWLEDGQRLRIDLPLRVKKPD